MRYQLLIFLPIQRFNRMYPSTLKFLVFLHLFLFIAGVSVPGFADVREVSQWRPYLEWSVENSNWSGNPFDIEATVIFTHLGSGESISTSMFYDNNDTWKWRFTGTIAGEWSYVTISGEQQLDGLTGQIVVTSRNVDGFYKRMTGDKWGWTGTNRPVIPNYLMIAENPLSWDESSEVESLIQEFIIEHGFTGFHVPSLGAFLFDINSNTNRFTRNPSLNRNDASPDPETFAALEQIIVKTHEAGGAVHMWLWGDSQRSQNLTVPAMDQSGGANGVVDKRMLRYLAARLGPLPGWSVGYGFDLFEWTNEQMLTDWAEFLHQELGWSHFLGARGRKNVITNSQISENLDYTGYEQHENLFDFDDWVSTMQDRTGKPSFSEDRFRIRRDDQGKDLRQDGSDTRTLLWDLAMAGGIAAIWGNLYDEPSLYESAPYPNKHQIKTYNRFWHERGYFQQDLLSNQSIHGDGDLRILVNRTSTSWVLYRQNCDSIDVDLSSAPSRLKAIAVDTKEVYNEIDLGVINNSIQTITFATMSDWVVQLTLSETIQPPQPGKVINTIFPLLKGDE